MAQHMDKRVGMELGYHLKVGLLKQQDPKIEGNKQYRGVQHDFLVVKAEIKEQIWVFKYVKITCGTQNYHGYWSFLK